MSIGVTLSEIDRRVRGKLSESGTQFFTPQIVLDWVNEAQDALATANPRLFEGVFNTRTVTNATPYQLPPEMITPRGAEMRDSGGRVVRCDYTEPAVFDRLKWGSNASASSRFRCTYIRDTEGTAIVLWPAPNQTLTLHVTGLMRPATLSALTDRTDIAPHLTQAVVWYCLSQAKFKDEETAQTQLAHSHWQEVLADLSAERMTVQADQFNRTRGSRPVGGFRW